MRALVDTNVFLDVLLDRAEWAEASRDVLNHLERIPGAGWIAWHTLSNLYYIGRKVAGEPQTRKSLARILTHFDVCPTDGRLASSALEFPLADFEDALQVAAGLAAKVDFILTRNGPDFRKSPLPVLSPEKALRTVLRG